ncbi:MAG: hypothetical protein ABSG95_10075 [Solirubrobacteraceae bacterium]|jgi:hypothetical protein
MPHINIKRSRAATAVLLLLLISLVLAACGGSSKSSSTSATASASTSASGGGGSGAASGRFTALRECLKKNGITLPKRTTGQAPGGGFLGGSGGPQLPKGVTRAQYEATVKKCGGSGFAGRGARTNSPAFKETLKKFAACMRQNGVNLPEPNSSGSGPIFNTKGLNTASTQFRSAESKCSADLGGAFRRGSRTSSAGASPPAAAVPSS